MKILLTAAIFLISGTTQAQENFSRYNEVLERTEYFDSHGLTGWSKEDTRLNKTVYYDQNGNVVEYDMHTGTNLSNTVDETGRLTGYKVWDKLLQRYEIYDSKNKLIGFYQYYPTLNLWQFEKH
jgi:hypothetical protein